MTTGMGEPTDFSLMVFITLFTALTPERIRKVILIIVNILILDNNTDNDNTDNDNTNNNNPYPLSRKNLLYFQRGQDVKQPHHAEFGPPPMLRSALHSQITAK